MKVCTKKLQAIKSTLMQHSPVITDNALADVVRLIESGYDVTKTSKHPEFMTAEMADAVVFLRKVKLNIVDTDVDEKAVFTVRGPIPGNVGISATCRVSGELLVRYLALALQDGFIDKVLIREPESKQKFSIFSNGRGSVSVTDPRVANTKQSFRAFVHVEEKEVEPEVKPTKPQKHIDELVSDVLVSNGMVPTPELISKFVKIFSASK